MQYIIATHGKLAQGYVDTIRLVAQVDGLHAICAYMDGSEFPEDMNRLLESFGPDEPVIVFTDLLGGSVTQKIMELWSSRKQFQVFAGVNLPFVIETILSGFMPSEEAVEDTLCRSREQMVWVNALLENMTDDKTSSCG